MDRILPVTLANYNGPMRSRCALRRTVQPNGDIMDNHVPKTISVPEAGRVYFDLARNAAYEAAHRGDIPVIKVGRMLRVPVVALERMLDEARPTRRSLGGRAA